MPRGLGVWTLTSERVPGWNAEGQGKMGAGDGIHLPAQCRQLLQDLTARFGKPPEDLVFEFVEM